MRILGTFVFLLLFLNTSFAQKEVLRYEDYIYSPNIRTVKFTQKDNYLSFPVLVLGGNNFVELEFDDLSADSRNLYYRVIQCDVNWQPTQLSDLDYIDGYAYDQMREFHFSFKTTRPFVHYRLVLPNENTKFTKSGNYLLKIYEDSGKERLMLTRRFVVIESQVAISARLVPPFSPGKFRTHHEIDFEASFSKFPVSNLRQELKAVVIQNNRWDNAITGLQPNFAKFDNQLWDYQDKVVFPAGKEYRWLDLRSLLIYGSQTEAIEQINNRYVVTLQKDRMFEPTQYLQIFDLNGEYVIGNNDRLTGRQTEDLSARIVQGGSNRNTSYWRDQFLNDENHFNHALGSDYADVRFSLAMNQALPANQELYIVGRFTDYQLSPEYKMTWDSERNAYVVTTLMKQGFYNYTYAIRDANSKVKVADLGAVDGNWWEAENAYSILIYYRPFGQMYDRIIAMNQVQSGIR
jgi:hypothetical protein